MPPSMAIDHHHLLHQPLVRQIRKASGDLRIVQREIAQLSLTVPPRELFDLCSANSAMPVVNHDIGIWPLCWRWQPLRTGRRALDAWAWNVWVWGQGCGSSG